LLSQLSLDFAKDGAPTLWGSFEIKYEKLLGKMMQQMSDTELANLTEVEYMNVRLSLSAPSSCE
jgi:hypothetical protein